ncbi:hypothetical protein [Micromonospora sp. DT47]|uniref:hypothetical protein n=1 Tax=Micromonospora sp. DT47 TaxID=3393431 RepID=UPI003CEEE33F
MSYDLAVWEGEHPADDGVAVGVYDQRYAAYMEGEEPPPTPRIRAYVLALLRRWVDMPDDEHGLVCYDPQWERLRPTPRSAARRVSSVPLGQDSRGQPRPRETAATRPPTR